MLVDGRLKIIHNCKVHQSAQFLNTDHRFVAATLKLQLKYRRMVPSQLRIDVDMLKSERVAEEFVNRVSGYFGDLGALGNHGELWSAFKTTILDFAGGCLGTHRQAKRNFVSQRTLDIVYLT